ncbi:MAG: hypothetical protein A2710_23280 [Burkholderiales bacterium RIFCSPHIGHO2_01_FULL_64_960]|nr:MAG: hypothetical protein A2710_23280 [Burkholderiales bacterium RIFCSPHIGHO2_01_FULL_64_960]
MTILPISVSWRPDRLLGLQFFSQAETVSLLERGCGAKAFEVITSQALDFVKEVRKMPMEANGSPSFCVVGLLARMRERFNKRRAAN